MSEPSPTAPPASRTGRLIAWALREMGVVAALLVVALGLLIFMGVADEMAEGDTRGLDRAILYGLRQTADPSNPIGPKWLEIAAADITALGSVTVLSLIVLLMAGFFAASRRWREALILIAAPLSGTAVSQVLKNLFGRARPDAALHAVEVVNPSFPSGHAMLSAVVYLTLAVLVARFTDRRRVKVYAMAAGVLLTLLVGSSRVFLGVHWPSDVLAGWSLGAAWALAWWLAMWLWGRAGARQG
ncbi:phosphatase PAP2 family protein [soil metagenome]